MEQRIHRGALSGREEFFYPDMPVGHLPQGLRLAMPRNGRPGVQLLLETDAGQLDASLESDAFVPEFFCMKAVPVEYNTGDGSEQGGAMVLERRPACKPLYTTRLAPFAVYDCLKPARDGVIETQNGRAALYLCLCPRSGLAAGAYTAMLRMGSYCCRLDIRVYDIEIPQDTFPVTNWFSLDAISRCHGLQKDTPAFYEMVRRYARAMRRIHQTMFYIELDEAFVASRAPYTFDFEYLRPLIRLFFDEGMQQMELGALLSRGFLPDGMPDMYTDSFKCAMAPELPIDTPEGYMVTVRFVQALAEFLRKYGWQDKVVFHIHDEPDIHFKNEASLLARKRQYYLAAGILRKYLPNVRVIEAVASPEFRGGVDIWVPADSSGRVGVGVCMLWAGGQLAQPFSGFCVVERTAAVLGLCGQSAGWFSALGFQPIPRRDGPVCRYKLPQPYRDRYEFPLWRFFPCLSGNGWSVAGYADGGRQARRRGCSASGAAALQG